MRRIAWLARVATGIAAAALAASGLACSSAAVQVVSEPPLAPVQVAALPVSGPVIALSSDDVWAATGVGEPGVLHWNGSQWAFVALPGIKGAVIESFAAVSSGDIWAVGAFDDDFKDEAPLVAHWDGQRWSRSYGSPRTHGELDAVAVAGKDVWAVGGTTSDSSGPGLILRLAAGHWHVVPNPARISLTALAMTSSSAGWASGTDESPAKGPLLRWNGTAWVSAAAALSAGDQLWALAAGPSGRVWGVGSIDPGFDPFSQYWTGRAWRAAPVRWPGPSAGLGKTLQAVSAIPGGGAWAIGYAGEQMPGQSPAIFRWSGNAWTMDWRLDRPAGNLAGIGVISPTDAWSVGYECTGVNSDNGCSGDQFLVLHWDGRTWNETWLPTNFQPAG